MSNEVKPELKVETVVVEVAESPSATLIEGFKFPVVEIFSSFQGEGAFMGMATTFVRFAGCNLRCPWCDSKETWDESSDKILWMTSDEIIAKIDKELVVLTGGEPCLQSLTYLIECIKDAKGDSVLVAVETNGTMATPINADWVTCSPKAEAAYLIHGECHFNELKYVVDETFDISCVPEEPLQKHGQVWLQPESGKYSSMVKIAGLVDKNPGVRAGIQLHKIYNAR